MNKILFSGWDSLLRTLVIGVLAYVVLIVFLRIAGKRTLSKMNAFDLVVTVALGSALANLLLNRTVALADGALAFAILVGLQFIVTWTSVRWGWVRQVVTGEPRLLLHEGEMLPQAMRAARVTADEVRAAIRAARIAAMGDVKAVVLETDGSFSVIQKSPAAGDGASSMEGVVVPGRVDGPFV